MSYLHPATDNYCKSNVNKGVHGRHQRGTGGMWGGQQETRGAASLRPSCGRRGWQLAIISIFLQEESPDITLPGLSHTSGYQIKIPRPNAGNGSSSASCSAPSPRCPPSLTTTVGLTASLQSSHPGCRS